MIQLVIKLKNNGKANNIFVIVISKNKNLRHNISYQNLDK